MVRKSQTMRLLEGQGVDYVVLTYDKSERDAETIAGLIGFPPGQVFKTLVVVRDKNKPILAMVPADRQLSLKKLAKQIGEKKVKMASHSQAEELTGLQVGGISPLALINRGFSIVLDNSAEEFKELVLSAGQRGLQIQLPVGGLIKVTGAQILDLTD